MTPILMFNLLVSSVFLLFVKNCISKRTTMLNTFSFCYVLSCCIGLSFLHLFPDSVDADLLRPVAIHRAVIASLLCQLILFIFLTRQNARMTKVTSLMEKTFTLSIAKGSLLHIQLIVIVGFIFSLIVILQWFYFSSGYKYFMKAFLDFGESGAYYLFRQMIGEEITGSAGRGAYLSKRIMLNFGPLIMVYSAFLYKCTKKLQYIFIVIGQAILGLLVAGVYSHKSSLTLALIFPFISFTLWNMKQISNKTLMIFSLLLASAFGLTLYLTTGNLNIVQGFFRRIILVPAFVSTFYFDIFPDIHEFRGLLEMFYINNFFAAPGHIAIHDVGAIITGKGYGANASFIAVGYSGMGMFGVVLLATILAVILLTLDRKLSTYLPENVRLVCVLSNIPGLMSIISESLTGALLNGYMFFPILSLFLIRSNYHKSICDLNRTLQQEATS